MVSGNMARIGTEVEGLSRAADVVGWVEHSSSGHVSFTATTTAAIKLFTTDLHFFRTVLSMESILQVCKLPYSSSRL